MAFSFVSNQRVEAASSLGRMHSCFVFVGIYCLVIYFILDLFSLSVHFSSILLLIFFRGFSWKSDWSPLVTVIVSSFAKRDKFLKEVGVLGLQLGRVLGFQCASVGVSSREWGLGVLCKFNLPLEIARVTFNSLATEETNQDYYLP